MVTAGSSAEIMIAPVTRRSLSLQTFAPYKAKSFFVQISFFIVQSFLYFVYIHNELRYRSNSKLVHHPKCRDWLTKGWLLLINFVMVFKLKANITDTRYYGYITDLHFKISNTKSCITVIPQWRPLNGVRKSGCYGGVVVVVRWSLRGDRCISKVGKWIMKR